MQNSNFDVQTSETRKKYSEIFFWPLVVTLIGGFILLYWEYFVIGKNVDEANKKIAETNQRLEYIITNSNELKDSVAKIMQMQMTFGNDVFVINRRK